MNSLIAEIKTAFVNESGFRIVPTLDRAQVSAWMQSDDIDVQATLFRRLGYKGERATIEPPLDLKQYHAFCLGYFRQCLDKYNPEIDEYDDQVEVSWGHEATHNFVRWFDALWRDKSVPRSILDNTKVWLAEVLMTSPHISLLMQNTVFGHLLYRKSIRKFFADWENDPYLRQFLV